MTVPIGYRPDRIESLEQHTRQALDDLRSLRSSDPAAATAMRSITATIRVLEDHWMPLIIAIRASQVLVAWSRSTLAAVDRTREFMAGPNRLASLSDDQLIAEIFTLDQRWAASPGWYDKPDLAYGDDAALLALMHALEARVAADQSFGTLLLATAGDVDALLLFLSRGAFPTHLVAEAVRSTIGPPSSVGSAGLRRALLTDALLQRTAGHPEIALDLLVDVEVAGRILAFDEGLDIWTNRPSTPGVAGLIHAGLVGAPSQTPDRRADGFDVLGWFIERANEPRVDRDGFSPGVAAGLAIAMQHYTPMFIHSIDGSDSEAALPESGIHADRTGNGLDDPLAGYEEMTDFFGALLHDTEAVPLLGILLAITADNVAHQRSTLSEAAHLAGLLRDAARNEDREAVIAAAARSAQRGHIIDALAIAAKATTGVGGTAKLVFDASRKFVTQLSHATEDGSDSADADFDPGSVTRHLVQMASIRRLAADDRHRHDLGIRSTPDAWSDVSRRLDELDRLTARGASPREVQTARQRIFNRVRELGGGEAIDALDNHGILATLPNRDVHAD